MVSSATLAAAFLMSSQILISGLDWVASAHVPLKGLKIGFQRLQEFCMRCESNPWKDSVDNMGLIS